MKIFYTVFVKVFAFLVSISVFFFLLIGFLTVLANKHENQIFTNSSKEVDSKNKIALLNLEGPIIGISKKKLDIGFFDIFNTINSNFIEKALKEIKDQKVSGLVISINSPGGTVSESYKIYNIIKDFKEKNEIKIFFHTNEMIASGAYWMALSADKIFADYGSLIGSIGVKGPDWIYFDNPISISSGILSNSIETRNGIKKFNNIAGNSKDIFDPFRKPTEKEIYDLQKNVQIIYEDFVNLVSKNRKIEKNFIINDIGAMIYGNKVAEEKYLIDGTKSIDEVIKALAKDLELEEFQIIQENRKDKKIFNNIVNSIFYSNEQLDNFKINNEKNLCKNVKIRINSIFFINDFEAKC